MSPGIYPIYINISELSSKYLLEIPSRDEEDQSILHMHIRKWHNETHQTLFEKVERESRNGSIIKKLNFFKVDCSM
jgi:hypothetical protein